MEEHERRPGWRPPGGIDVDAVDAAIGPEIDEHDLAAQLVQGKRAVDVEPIQIARSTPASAAYVSTPMSSSGEDKLLPRK